MLQCHALCFELDKLNRKGTVTEGESHWTPGKVQAQKGGNHPVFCRQLTPQRLLIGPLLGCHSTRTSDWSSSRMLQCPVGMGTKGQLIM